jgi:hypothetical protein
MKSEPQIFYTQEGKAYVLKTATKYTAGYVVGVPPQNLNAFIEINASAINTNPDVLSMQTTKPMIPVSLSISITDVTAPASPVVVTDITSTYYTFLRVTAGVPTFLDPDGHKAISKMIPLIQRVFYTSDFFYGYNVKYNDFIPNDSDFLIIQGLSYLYFQPSLANALTGYAPTNTLPVGSTTLNATVVFTYFELL